MSFDVDIGWASERGPRTEMEDFAAVRRPGSGEAAWGVIAAVADGVSQGGLGKEAAQTTVMGLLRDWYATPATWDPTVALERLISSQNAWLIDHNRRRQSVRREDRSGGAGMSTLTALVLRAHGYTLAHVGDTRAWLIRHGECTLLTQDHTLGQLTFQNGLTRAIGLDESVKVDYFSGDLQVHDVFVLTSDGVHGVLSARQIQQFAQQGGAPQEAADAMVAKALASGGRDNATALVIRITGLDAATLEDHTRRSRQLPVPQRLKDGEVIDGMQVEALVFNNGVHRVYRVKHLASGRVQALKTLHEARASDPEERQMLAHEAWLGARVSEREARGFLHVVEPDQATFFYTLSDWLAGQTLGHMLEQGQRFPVHEIVAGITALVRTLGRLHQHGVIHRDIKPDNLHLGDDGQWRILDLGVALSGKEPESLRVLHAGTPSYMNPEQWGDDPALSRATFQSDLFALGVSLYVWLTGRLPHGEIEPYQIARYRRDPVPPSRLRPDVPIWLDHIVLKAIARDHKQRFETAEEMLLALERGASRPLSAPAASPLLARDPAMVWKIALGVSVLVNLLLVYWLVFLPSGR